MGDIIGFSLCGFFIISQTVNNPQVDSGAKSKITDSNIEYLDALLTWGLFIFNRY